MTDDQQALYDEFANLKELAATATRAAATYDRQAQQQREIARTYTDRANAIAKQLGFSS